VYGALLVAHHYPNGSSVGVPLSGSDSTGNSCLPVVVSWGSSGLVTGSSARALLEGVEG